MLYQCNHSFKLILYACLILFGFGCEKNPVDTEDDTYWTIPEWDGVYLSFRHSEDIKVDSILAGNIQYRLNVAMSVDEKLANMRPCIHWLSDQLVLRVSDEVYIRLDTSSHRFGIQALDALITHYPILHVQKIYSSPDNIVILYFIKDYNVPELAKVFEDIEGIHYTHPVFIEYFVAPPDIKLVIEGDVYQFSFIGRESVGYWEIHVVDDQATIVSRP